MTARQFRAHLVDVAVTVALPAAVFLVAVALSLEVDGWLAFAVVAAGGAVALAGGMARARWYRRGGAA